MADDGVGGTLPDVIDLLTADHERIAELIDAGDRSAVVRELSKHLVGEDQILYPELRRTSAEDELVDTWLDSDRKLEEALLEVDKGKQPDMGVVAERFAGHRQTQEAETFPMLRNHA